MIYTLLNVRPAITNISIFINLVYFALVSNDKQNKRFYSICVT